MSHKFASSLDILVANATGLVSISSPAGRRRSNDGDQSGDLPAQKAAH